MKIKTLLIMGAGLLASTAYAADKTVTIASWVDLIRKRRARRFSSLPKPIPALL